MVLQIEKFCEQHDACNRGEPHQVAGNGHQAIHTFSPGSQVRLKGVVSRDFQHFSIADFDPILKFNLMLNSLFCRFAELFSMNWCFPTEIIIYR
jgi:hypothetical protein